MPIIAIAPRVVLDAIDGRSPTVRLSAATAAKQTRRHPGFARGDYAKVQLILDEGELFRKRAREMNGFVEAEGRLWRAAIKTTRDGAETYLTTFHIAKPRDLAAAKRRLRRIDRGEEWEAPGGSPPPRSPEGMRGMRNASGAEGSLAAGKRCNKPIMQLLCTRDVPAIISFVPSRERIMVKRDEDCRRRETIRRTGAARRMSG